MFKKLLAIWELLDSEYRFKFLFIQSIILVAAILELLSIFSIGPFISVVLGVIKLTEVPVFGSYIFYNFGDNAIYVLGCVVGFFILASNIFFSYTLYMKAKFSYTLGAQTSNNLIRSFLSNKLNKDNNSKNKILSNSTFESDRFSRSVINELMQINARGTVALFIIAYLVFTYGGSFLIFVLYMVGVYIVISWFIKEKLKQAGLNLTANSQQRLRNVNDIYDCFYEVKSYHSEDYFLNKQKTINHDISGNLANIELYSVLPKYLVESIIFISLLLFISYQYSLNHNVNNMVPMGAQLMYGIMKLIPQISGMYQAYSNLSGNINCVDEIAKVKFTPPTLPAQTDHSTVIERIVIDDLIFTRDNKTIFKNFSYTFEKNKIYSIKGPSGIGKTTLLSILFGLLHADSGEIQFLDKDGTPQQNPKIAFIPQHHHLILGNIETNIAFGIDEQETDIGYIFNILKNINLEELHNLQEDDLKLSGGQIQRVCFGRFLYHNFDIVLLDEPTSALDKENEKVIFELIQKNKKDKIIIMVSHAEAADLYTDKVIRLGS